MVDVGKNKGSKVTQQTLFDFIATVDENDYDDKTLLEKFPEFENDNELLSAAKDYYATSKSGKYNSVDEINSKFPEFEGLKKKTFLRKILDNLFKLAPRKS